MESKKTAPFDQEIDTAHRHLQDGELEEAEALYRSAYKLRADDERAFIGLLDVLTKRDKWPEAVEIAESFSVRKGDTFEAQLYLATVFSHLDAEQAVVHFLTTAESRPQTKKQQARLNFLKAANGLPVADLDQHNMAVGIFDNFANSYDETLAQIGNQGPKLIHGALRDLDLPKKKKRHILDAGCGTGLCGGFLRKYGKELTGADISPNMLAKAHEKKLYSNLARTDLAERVTYPEGPFDLIVCADVLVYFGELNTVVKNLAGVLAPGGWLLATVEDEVDPTIENGFRLGKSGRYKHSKGYLLKTLANAGFPKPKLLRNAPIRTEMLKSVTGTVFAVQKSVFSF